MLRLVRPVAPLLYVLKKLPNPSKRALDLPVVEAILARDLTYSHSLLKAFDDVDRCRSAADRRYRAKGVEYNLCHVFFCVRSLLSLICS